MPVTGPLPGVEWTVEGLLRDARARDGYVRDVDQVGADAAGPSTRRVLSAEAARELGELHVEVDRVVEVVGVGLPHGALRGIGWRGR